MERPPAQPNTESLDRLLIALDSKDPAERERAERELHKLGAGALPLLVSVLERPLEDARRFSNFSGVSTLLLMFVGALFLCSLSPYPWYGRIGMFLFFFLNPGIFIAIGWGALCFTARRFGNRSKRRKSVCRREEMAVRAAAMLDDVRAIAPLVTVIRTPNIEMTKETLDLARRGLIRLLPRLETTPEVSMTSGLRKDLCRLLELHSRFVLTSGGEDGPPQGVPRSGFDVSMTFALLRVYRRIGDRRALKIVQRLAKALPIASQELAAQVIEAAQQCLPFLEERVAEADLLAKQTLLRPFDASAAPNATLLRPAGNAPETHEQVLLRPLGQKENHDDA